MYPTSPRSTRSPLHASRSRLSLSVAAVATVLLTALGTGLVSPVAVRAATSTVPFRLSASSSLLAVTPGGSATFTVNSTRTRGFTSPIYLGVAGLTRGITVRFSRNPLPSNASASTVTVSVAQSFSPRTVTLTLSGSSKGKTSRAVVRVAVSRTGSPSSTIPSGPTVPTNVPTTVPAPPVTTTTLPVATTSTTRPATPTTVPLSDYTLSVEPAALPMSAGGTATATLRINRTGGFNQPLEAVVENLPVGMTGSVDPIGSTDVTATVRLSTSSTIASGTYDLNIRARGRNAVLRVSVAGNALGAIPSTLTIAQGASGTASLTLGRPVSASTVNWSVDVLPVGVTATFSPNATTAVATTMTILPSASAGTGTYILTLRASSDGGSVTSPFTLVVGAGAKVSATVNPATLNVLPGGNSSVTITAPSLPAGPPALTAVNGLPAGSAGAIAVNGAVITYNFTVPTTTPVGTYNVTFTVAQGGGTAVGALTLVVSTTTTPSAGNTSAFTLSLGAPSLSVARGTNGVISVLVTWSAGVAQQPITFATTGAPVGSSVGYSLNPNTVGTTVNLGIPVGATPGAYTVSISGNVTSIGTFTVTLPVTVT